MTYQAQIILKSAMIVVLTAQLVLIQPLYSAPTQAEKAPSKSKRDTQTRRLQKLSRPVRPKHVEPGVPLVGKEIFVERYADGSVHIEREVSLDTDGNYQNHGPCRIWSRNGDLIAEGDYKMGARHGIWTRWVDRKDSPILREPPFSKFSTPFLSQATFNDGVLDGEWLIFDAEQRKCSQISIRQGKRHGLVIQWSANGEIVQQSTFKDGIPQGDVLMLHADRKKLDRVKVFLGGREVISKKTNFSNSKQIKSEESYLGAPTIQKTADDFWNIQFATYKPEGSALKHGDWKKWYSTGKPQMQGQYERGKKMGKFVFWHTNGQIASEGEYFNDKHEGEWVWWHANGQKAVLGNYRNGTLVDQWHWWDEEGRLTKQLRYDESGTLLTTQEAPKLRLGLENQQNRQEKPLVK